MLCVLHTQPHSRLDLDLGVGVDVVKPKCTVLTLWKSIRESFVSLSSLELFDLALKEKVAFVPGPPFFTGGRGENNLRLNFSNADEDKIELGIQRLGKAVHTLMLR